MSITAQLIKTIKQYPILYDVNHEDYKNFRKKDRLWEQIGHELNETGDIVKKKWKNLRDSYAKYLKSTKEGEESSHKYKKWHWAQKMEAFRPHLAYEKISSENKDEEVSDIKIEINDPEEYKQVEFVDMQDEENYSLKSQSPPPPRLKSATKKRNAGDSIDLIFQGYAQTLKSFSPKRQAYTKLKIAELMIEQELQHQEEQE